MEKSHLRVAFFFAGIVFPYLCTGSVRPAPFELPQIRKEARVKGCSGAIPALFLKPRH